ncbi:peptidoglycan DD-metalloendopeptidase family protein [Streptomyces sp. RKND-216]|uniref:M23 family metallopeptidase n=1 Tax=Streptomyces sp. RKND-216 TaxID=2562581 RepID=UPI001FF9A6A8|nr:peptidoglycan DD-metalloendopeptidase family protein [Streptomyces sp. RKND-216]
MRLHTTITDALGRIPRTRNAVIAGGVGASLALGSGVALAAGDDMFATDTPAKAAHATQQQADAAEKKDRKADTGGQGEKAEKKAGAAQDGKDEKKDGPGKQAQAEKKAQSRDGGHQHKAGGGKDGKAKKAKKASRGQGRAQAPSWSLPVDKPYTKTAGFADSGNRWSATHSGQDFAVPTGTGVKAVHGGTVVTTGWGGSYGNRIVIEHPNGKYSQYAHLSKIGVGTGEQVNTGEQIGQSGSTGNSSGPHLHFEIRTTPAYGSGFDPVPFLKSHGLHP